MRGRHLRQRAEGGEQRASALELFFDLVFVFAITQLSHLLLEDLTFAGAGKTLVLLLAAWWAWNYTTWMMNWFDPDSPAVRGVLIAVALASLLMAIAIPEAFGARALLFAGSYAGLQVVRNAFALYASEPGSQLRGLFVRILAWSAAVGALWVVGATLPVSGRTALWLAALAVDFAGPLAGYWVPGRGRSATTDWQIESSHFAERFQLFVIIALGESIVVTGATASGLDVDAARGTAIAVAFLGAAALWWLYFDYVAAIAQRRLEKAGDRGRLARDAYTYLHIPIVAGIIVSAVGNELVIAHPGDRLDGPELTALAAGPALYLLGHVGFRLRMAGSLSVKRLSAALAVVAIAGLGAFLPALATAGLIVVALAVLIGAELVSGARRRARGEPSPLARLG